jgi:hypothetical protein
MFLPLPGSLHARTFQDTPYGDGSDPDPSVVGNLPSNPWSIPGGLSGFPFQNVLSGAFRGFAETSVRATECENDGILHAVRIPG